MPPKIFTSFRSIFKISALLTFVVNFAAQIHLQSCLPSPDILIPRSYAPNRHFLNVFFSFSSLVNVLWLKQLLMKQSDNHDDVPPTLIKLQRNQRDQESALPYYDHPKLPANPFYLPFYIFGNILLALSSFVAAEGFYDLSHIFLISNMIVQLLLIRILSEDARYLTITPATFLTHLVMKTNVGFVVLLVWRTWSILNKMADPTVGELIIIALTFLLITISSGPDPTLGLCLLFVLLSLIFSNDIPPTANAVSVATWQFTFIVMTIVIASYLLFEIVKSKRRGFPWLYGWKAFWYRTGSNRGQ